jgi:hypothetical protein
MTDWYFYPYKALTGGADGSLDSIDGSLLKDLDGAIVLDAAASRLRAYVVDADSAAAEDSPRVIQPDANAGDKRFVKVRLYEGAHEYLSSYTNLEAAIAGIGSTGTTLVIDADSAVDADATVPATLALEFRSGNILTVASGKVLTINGKMTAGPYQAFAGAGTVKFAKNAVTEIYPEWWGTFPNGSDDSAVLNKAIAAADLTGGTNNGFEDASIIVRPGVYNIPVNTISTIKYNFLAPNAMFLRGATTTEDDTVLTFDFSENNSSGRRVEIGQIYGADVLEDTTHYGVGVKLLKGDQADFTIGSLQGLYTGIMLPGSVSDAHIGINRFKVNSIIGCDYGMLLTSKSGSNSQCELNQFDVNYITYCDTAIALISTTGDKVCAQNLFRIGSLELHARDNQVGIYISGPETTGNVFRVIGALTGPTGASGLIANILDSAHDNLFELCFIDWTKINYGGAYYNIWRQGAVEQCVAVGESSATGRSEVLMSAAPTSHYWRIADRVWSSNTAAGVLGWVATANGDGDNANWRKFGGIFLEASAAWNPGTIDSGRSANNTITVPGAGLGDFVLPSCQASLAPLALSAQVVSANNVMIQLLNVTASNLNTNNQLYQVRVFKLT